MSIKKNKGFNKLNIGLAIKCDVRINTILSEHMIILLENMVALMY